MKQVNACEYTYICENITYMTAPDQLAHLKFPIGPFKLEDVSPYQLAGLINTIEASPAKYRDVTKGLSERDLKKTYREGAWNVQQLVNHVADIQLLHFFRMKRAITESDYKEITLVNIPGWAATADGLTSPIADSIEMMEAINKRFVYLMRSLSEQQHEISYYHPLRKETFNQKQAIGLTAWHVEHHLAHIKTALAG
jgi:hypothetical protein